MAAVLEVEQQKAIIARWAACECCYCRAPLDPCRCSAHIADKKGLKTAKEKAERRKKRK